MAIHISTLFGPDGVYTISLDGDGQTLTVDVEDVADIQRELTIALSEAFRLKCVDMLASEGAVVIPMTTSLRWVREGAGSHSYVSVAPGGVQLRVALRHNKWSALVDGHIIGEMNKKREAQVLCENHVSSQVRTKV